MVRIAGIDLQDKLRVEIALTAIYGLGKSNVKELLKSAHVDGDKRMHALTEEDIVRIQKIIDKEYTVEGVLRRQVADNIKRLSTIGSYRGLRHKQGLPVRGQHTRSNARTKRGKKKTVGAMRKEDRTKMEKAKKTD